MTDRTAEDRGPCPHCCTPMVGGRCPDSNCRMHWKSSEAVTSKTVTDARIRELLVELDSGSECTKAPCDECDTIAALQEVLKRRAAETTAPRSLAQAKDAAEKAFDEWNDVTGVFPRGVSYDAEIRSVIADAVEFGWKAAPRSKFDMAFEIMRQLDAERMDTMQSCHFGYVLRVERERASEKTSGNVTESHDDA